MVVKRDKRLHMLLSQEEWSMLQELADRDGVTASDWVRLRIREAYDPRVTLESVARKRIAQRAKSATTTKAKRKH